MDEWDLKEEVISAMADYLKTAPGVSEKDKKMFNAFSQLKMAKARVEALGEEAEEQTEADAVGESVKEHVAKDDNDVE